MAGGECEFIGVKLYLTYNVGALRCLQPADANG